MFVILLLSKFMSMLLKGYNRSCRRRNDYDLYGMWLRVLWYIPHFSKANVDCIPSVERQNCNDVLVSVLKTCKRIRSTATLILNLCTKMELRGHFDSPTSWLPWKNRSSHWLEVWVGPAAAWKIWKRVRTPPPDWNRRSGRPRIPTRYVAL